MMRLAWRRSVVPEGNVDTVLKYSIAVGLPLILIVFGAIAKAVGRKSPMILKDWYFGIELVLSALGADLLYMFELLRWLNSASINSLSLAIVKAQLPFAILFPFIAYPVLMYVIRMHREWESIDGKL